jgi:hypothetical protein
MMAGVTPREGSWVFARAKTNRALPIRTRAIVLALLVGAVAYAATAGVAVAATASTSDAAAALQTDFGTQVADYVAITRELHRTEAEVERVRLQIAQGRAQIDVARSALASRAVELYRSSGTGLLESLLAADSIGDMVRRYNYLSLVTRRDAQILRDSRLAQTEESWLQESLVQRVDQLQELQVQADKRQAQLLANLKAQQAKAAAAKTTFAPGTDSSGVASQGSDPRTQFVRSNVISNNNFRNGRSMSVNEIQNFLNKQPGALKSYTGKDHSGTTKSAAQMISQECIRFNINPKVMLATLQKEQSLLGNAHPQQSQLDWALGAGKADTFTSTRMKGFGNQIYWGAQKFNKNARDWHSGSTEPVDHKSQVCDNEGTFAQYRYTPHYSGVMSFWTIYWRYFGDPLS